MDDYVRPSDIEPGWEIWRGGEWAQIQIIIETETPEGTRYFWFHTEGGSSRVPATAKVRARKP